ncbi:hypothetical protein JAB8_07450 [Janthinobacterium sp. HH106]|nr:hypothetical protein JAB8_07450 [Janthinobacterium sp. HH106]
MDDVQVARQRRRRGRIGIDGEQARHIAVGRHAVGNDVPVPGGHFAGRQGQAQGFLVLLAGRQVERDAGQGDHIAGAVAGAGAAHVRPVQCAIWPAHADIDLEIAGAGNGCMHHRLPLLQIAVEHGTRQLRIIDVAVRRQAQIGLERIGAGHTAAAQVDLPRAHAATLHGQAQPLFRLPLLRHVAMRAQPFNDAAVGRQHGQHAHEHVAVAAADVAQPVFRLEHGRQMRRHDVRQVAVVRMQGIEPAAAPQFGFRLAREGAPGRLVGIELAEGFRAPDDVAMGAQQPMRGLRGGGGGNDVVAVLARFWHG